MMERSGFLRQRRALQFLQGLRELLQQRPQRLHMRAQRFDRFRAG
jgi:hypothetical protein